MKTKSLKDFLLEDDSLTEEIRSENFEEKKTASNNVDSDLERVYASYQSVVDSL